MKKKIALADEYLSNNSAAWHPQPKIESQDDYSAALETASRSIMTEEIAIDDQGSYERTGRAWMKAWFAMFNAYWMAGNTGNSPGRDETWGQMYREVALRIRNDGRYYFDEIGTGAVGDRNDYEYTPQQAAESWVLLRKADLKKDGQVEAIYLDESERDNGVVMLHILDDNDQEIWSAEAGTSHVAWSSLFLLEQDGEYYLLRYLPGMWQGYCTYTYTLFNLEGGTEHVVRSKTIEFDVNGVNKLDAPKMITFAEEVNALLGKSTLLLSSEGGEYFFGPSSADQFFERYSWLNETPALYADGDDLKSRLDKFSEYVVSNHR